MPRSFTRLKLYLHVSSECSLHLLFSYLYRYSSHRILITGVLSITFSHNVSWVFINVLMTYTPTNNNNNNNDNDNNNKSAVLVLT
jgi:hypothetical protein